MIEAVSDARALLRTAGYDGPVVTVDTFIAVGNHPELCEASDYCAINAHPFFDSTISATQAGQWVRKTVDHLQSLMLTPKSVLVTETGWPTNGISNGLAVPTLLNQQIAISAIRKAFGDDLESLILLSVFDDLWKTNSVATFYTDKYWGIDGAIAQCDEQIQEIDAGAGKPTY